MASSDHRNECYPILPLVDWAATCKQRAVRRAALDERNDLIGQGGAARAVAATKDGNIGGGKTKEPREAKKP